MTAHKDIQTRIKLSTTASSHMSSVALSLLLDSRRGRLSGQEGHSAPTKGSWLVVDAADMAQNGLVRSLQLG